jgi:hypothetical protein
MFDMNQYQYDISIWGEESRMMGDFTFIEMENHNRFFLG